MPFFPASLENLIDKFASLPGIGRKSAVRMAYQVMSMPAEQAPERMISAFSMITTLSEGSSFAASVATKHPALPPPMIRRSHVTTCISMSDNCFGWKGCIRLAAILAIVVLLKTISECGIHLEAKIRAYRPLFYQSGNSFWGGVTFSCP